MTRIEQILTERRMSDGLDNPGNSLKGLYDLINTIKRPDMQIIEIGNYEGATAELFFLTLEHKSQNINPHLYCIDPYAKGEFFGQETLEDLDRAEKVFIQRMMKDEYYLGGNLTKIKKKSLNAVNMFDRESIDLCYIDGDHRVFSVMMDILSYAPKVKQDGWIAGHDYNDSVKIAVDKLIGKPDMVFEDSSWIISKSNFIKQFEH